MEVALNRIPLRYINFLNISSNYTRYVAATPHMKHTNSLLYWQTADFVSLNTAVRTLQAGVKGSEGRGEEYTGFGGET
jgi:hypothetical protein